MFDHKEKQIRWYHGIKYTVDVYESPPRSLRGHQRVVVASTPFRIESVREKRCLSESWIRWWWNPEPISKTEHIEMVKEEMKSRIEEYNDRNTASGVDA